ncbi:MAG: hypothetical protein ACRDZM_17460 [Acidimicrobiia bacterium]
MGILDELAQENRQRREQEAAETAQAQDIAWRIAEPEAAKQRDKERKAKKEELRSMLAELEAEGSDDDE